MGLISSEASLGTSLEGSNVCTRAPGVTVSSRLSDPTILQGRVRTKTVKRASRQIIEKYYNRCTLDFHTNKRVAEEVAVIQSKRLRNKIAGFTTVCSGAQQSSAASELHPAPFKV